MHHGVKITDEALVDAAVESDRYIADRFLPDKAIDLVDEAAAKLKMEISTKPEALDEVDRKVCTSRLPWDRVGMSYLVSALVSGKHACSRRRGRYQGSCHLMTLIFSLHRHRACLGCLPLFSAGT